MVVPLGAATTTHLGTTEVAGALPGEVRKVKAIRVSAIQVQARAIGKAMVRTTGRDRVAALALATGRVLAATTGRVAAPVRIVGRDNAEVLGRSNVNFRGGFNGSGHGYPPTVDSGGHHPFNGGNQEGFNGYFHPGAGGDGYDNRNRRCHEYRPPRAGGGQFPGRGNGRGRSRERYTVVPKPADKSAVVSRTTGARPISDAEVSKAVAGAITAVGGQKKTSELPSSSAAPMMVTMEPVAAANAVSTNASATVSIADASSLVDKVGVRKTKKKEKNSDKVKCFRCNTVGHYSIECTVPICDFYESAEHANEDCPLHSAPKSVLTVYGYAHEGLVFCDVQNSESFRPRPDNGRFGRISVTGGTPTSDEIKRVLRGLALDDHFPWEVEAQENNSYRTQFPSKLELTRATRFGTFLAKEDSNCFVKITEWKSEVKPTLQLDEVWILVSGVPEGLLTDYLALWGLCGMIGKTSAVDMAYTRRHEVVCALVRVTDISMIPYSKVIMYKGDGYKLEFEIDMDAAMLVDDEIVDDGHADDGDHDGDGKGNDSNRKDEEDKDRDRGSEKEKEPVTKPGVILPTSVTKTLLLTPAMKFGSFSDRWSDIMEADEANGVPKNTCRRLFVSSEDERMAGANSDIGQKDQTDLFESGCSDKLVTENFTDDVLSAPFPAAAESAGRSSVAAPPSSMLANSLHTAAALNGSPRVLPPSAKGPPTTYTGSSTEASLGVCL
ncbi:hypothetical protein ACQ4PT_040359 [Festuca glaucescens]